ncbi:MAG: WD40 repeat domain-containing protein [Planctomycetia bacterium]|nr:WD40 repeat domain-containing protein [Planctomycetia bacterium]
MSRTWSVFVLLLIGLALVDAPDVLAQQRREFVGHLGPVLDVQFSPDQKFVISGAIDATVRFWSIDGKLLETFKHKGPARAVAISPDGKLFISGADDRTARLAAGKKEIGVAMFEGGGSAVAFSPDGTRVAVGSAVRTPDKVGAAIIKIFDTATMKEEQELKGGINSVIALTYSPDGARLAAGTRKGELHLWDVVAGKQLAEIPGHHAEINALRFSPDGKQLAAMFVDKFLLVKVYDGETGKELAALPTLAKWCHSLTFAPDGKRLVGTLPERLVVWDTATFKETASVPLKSPRAAAFTARGDLLVITGGSASENHKLALQTVPLKK